MWTQCSPSTTLAGVIMLPELSCGNHVKYNQNTVISTASSGFSIDIFSVERIQETANGQFNKIFRM